MEQFRVSREQINVPPIQRLGAVSDTSRVAI